MKSKPVISDNFLERIAPPGSRFHHHYLAFRTGEITRLELIARLPYITLLGDSVCRGTYISSTWSTFWRARIRHRMQLVRLLYICGYLQRFERTGGNHPFRCERIRGHRRHS